MKSTKILLIILSVIILIISIVESRKRKSHHKKAHKKRENDDKGNFKVANPLRRFGNKTRVFYLTKHQAFPTQIGPQFNKNLGVHLNKRSCTILCQDRIGSECSNGVIAKEHRTGVLDCICNSTLDKSEHFVQHDYCYHVKGCYAKPSYMSCSDK